MKEGETFSVHDMLKAIAVASGNDACVAMAEHLAGSEAAFVERMNARAAELGMTPRAVEGRLYRIKKRLRRALEGREER